jgi:hypothetical protein
VSAVVVTFQVAAWAALAKPSRAILVAPTRHRARVSRPWPDDAFHLARLIAKPLSLAV